ncbi:uncharacterized protein LOC118766559 isoform X2 [Octopus sinensis]|uniref:Uncharacterized protein LOC118766559 isoform X2 n=1 Tax=Octopus sinensis TaxID=2607531 RepID=A0A7E6FEW5_9MOLL|nr:uncharacterized protein LOC118766559 isoform X2 [Octopus sinensis]
MKLKHMTMTGQEVNNEQFWHLLLFIFDQVSHTDKATRGIYVVYGEYAITGRTAQIWLQPYRSCQKTDHLQSLFCFVVLSLPSSNTLIFPILLRYSRALVYPLAAETCCLKSLDTTISLLVSKLLY